MACIAYWWCSWHREKAPWLLQYPEHWGLCNGVMFLDHSSTYSRLKVCIRVQDGIYDEDSLVSPQFEEKLLVGVGTPCKTQATQPGPEPSPSTTPLMQSKSRNLSSSAYEVINMQISVKEGWLKPSWRIAQALSLHPPNRQEDRHRLGVGHVA